MLEYKLRLWLGSGIFAFGIFGWTWFLRNAFKRKMDQALFYKQYHPMIQVFWNTLWIIVGLWVYPIEKTIPLIPLIIGIVIGLYVSKGGKGRYKMPDRDDLY